MALGKKRRNWAKVWPHLFPRKWKGKVVILCTKLVTPSSVFQLWHCAQMWRVPQTLCVPALPMHGTSLWRLCWCFDQSWTIKIVQTIADNSFWWRLLPMCDQKSFTPLFRLNFLFPPSLLVSNWFPAISTPSEQTFINPSKGNWNQEEIRFSKGWVKKLKRDFSILTALIEKGPPFPLSVKSYLSCKQPHLVGFYFILHYFDYPAPCFQLNMLHVMQQQTRVA